MTMADKTTQAPSARSETAGAEATRGGVYFTPRVDIYETDKELILYADVPGVRCGDVDLRYERGELVLHARVQPRPRAGHAILEEYEEGDFYRAFQIHESIDSSRIAAECKNGVLTVHLPKAAEAQPRKVNVRGE
jgi:HSP20 family molecular chaperone IbpA